MGMWDSLKAWMKREAADLKDATDDLEQQLDADLSQRERQLNESPAEAMERLQAEIARNDSTLSELEDKIGQAGARAEASAGLERDNEPDEPDPDDLDRGLAD
jgi:phage shock protein A